MSFEKSLMEYFKQREREREKLAPGFTSWLPFWNIFSDQHRGTAEKTYTAPSHRD